MKACIITWRRCWWSDYLGHQKTVLANTEEEAMLRAVEAVHKRWATAN